MYYTCFFVNDTATTELYTYLHTLSLHDALPILAARCPPHSLASSSSSLAMTSSFFCTAPCTFSLPRLPSTSPSAPLDTLWLIVLQVRATVSISKIGRAHV